MGTLRLEGLNDPTQVAQPESARAGLLGRDSGTQTSSRSCLCITHAALLTVSEEFDPLFMENRDTAASGWYDGVWGRAGTQPRVPPPPPAPSRPPAPLVGWDHFQGV